MDTSKEQNNKYNNPVNKKLRKIEKLEKDGWKRIRLKEAEIGDIIRFSEDGEFLLNELNTGKWEVEDEPFIDEKNGRWTVKCNPIK